MTTPAYTGMRAGGPVEALERARETIESFATAVSELRPMVLGGDYDIGCVNRTLQTAEKAGADVTSLRTRMGEILREGGTPWLAACEVRRRAISLGLPLANEFDGRLSPPTFRPPHSEQPTLSATTVDPNLSKFSTSGGNVEAFDFSKVEPGIYDVQAVRWVVVDQGKARSYGPPHYDLPYILRSRKDLSFKGSLDFKSLPKIEEA